MKPQSFESVVPYQVRVQLSQGKTVTYNDKARFFTVRKVKHLTVISVANESPPQPAKRVA